MPQNSLKNSLLRLYQQHIGTDVVLQVKYKSVITNLKAHRLILSMRSEVFADEFCDKLIFSLITLVVEGVTPRIMELLIWYLYSDCLKAESIKDVMAFAKVAKYYRIAGIELACKEKLQLYTPNKNNVYALLDASAVFKMETLYHKCVEIVNQFPIDVLCSPRFQQASVYVVRTILKYTKTNVSRKLSLEAVLKWLQYSKRADTSVLSNFDIVSLSMEDFLDLIEKYPSALKADEAFSILSNMCRPGIMDFPKWLGFKCEANLIHTAPVSACVANIAENSIRIETLCKRQLNQSSLLGDNGFKGFVTLMIKPSKKFASQLKLTMLELAFGSNFVPEDIIELELFSFQQKYTEVIRKKLKVLLQATPENYYIAFEDEIKLQENYPYILGIQIQVEGLKSWRNGGPISNNQFRVAEVPEHLSYNTLITADDIPSLQLLSLSDWFVFIESETGNKRFIFTSFYFDTKSTNNN